MFERITPEEAGISSRYVADFIDSLQRHGLHMHSVLLMKGDKLFGEYYWAPFHRDFCHRMYSQTKSYVAVAVGLLEEEGKLSIQDKIADYFPEKIDRKLPEYLAQQTIRDMLTMHTSCQCPNWFTAADPDRTHLYFNESAVTRPSGTYFEYDSAGSQVLSSLVEKLSGMSLFDYLNEKIFKKLGTFQTATILKTRNGDSWGDSALVCTSRDMASFARFVMNYGSWKGERLMNEAYLRAATAPQTDNHRTAFDAYNAAGYGYQIWCAPEGGFSFNGMGCQFTVCLPQHDFIFVCTADNQGYEPAGYLIFAALYDHIVAHLEGASLPADPADGARLTKAVENLSLAHAAGRADSPFAGELNGKTYRCRENRQGISSFSFHFKGDGTGEFRYVNTQGEKALPFGLARNLFVKFPQLGYSDGAGGAVTEDGFMYDCASSAGWLEEKKLLLSVQIIDRYFGNMGAVFAFRGKEAAVSMTKTAENFLNEYEGCFTACQEE